MDTYKTVCDKCFRKTWYETEQPCKQTLSKGCPTCGSHEYIDKPVRCTGTLRVIKNDDLDPMLEPYYENKQRVEIEFTYGEKARGTIGKSTGWKPIYLLIKTKRSMGGEAITKGSIKTIRYV